MTTNSKKSYYHLNAITLSGKVIAMQRYQDRDDKLILTISNTEGCYYIEFLPASSAPDIEKGDQVLIHGSLFSRRRDGKDAIRISAKSITPMKEI